MINGRRAGLPYRYSYDVTGAPGWFLFDGLVKHDLVTGAEQRYAFGDGRVRQRDAVRAPARAPRRRTTATSLTFTTDLRPRLLGVPRVRRRRHHRRSRRPRAPARAHLLRHPRVLGSRGRVGSLMPIEVFLFLPQMRMPMDALVAKAQRRRGGRVHGRRAHGPPRATPGRRSAHVRRDGHRGLAGRAHRARHHRPPRAVRRLPPPGRARPGGRHPGPRLRRPLRARHRLGVGPDRAGHVRRRLHRAARAGRPVGRDARRSCGRSGRASPSTSRGASTSCGERSSDRPRSTASPS